MAYVIQSLKEKFPDIYKFLLRNQKSHNLIFFSPNGKLYAKESLKEKSFYYHHIFQKSRFDPTLYTNFYGKVLKLISDTAYKTYLGWTLEMIINVLESSYNDEGLFFYQTDGICIEEYSNVVKITDKDSLPCKRCSDSTEYLKYYSKFDIPKYPLFQNILKSMNSFIFAIKNNYILIKGHEDYLAKVFKDKIHNFILAFEIIFKNNSIIAKEYVDSYIFFNLYDSIMNKLKSFYFEEQKDIKLQLEDKIDNYSILKLNLDSSLLRCNFNETYNKLDKLKIYKTCFEKTNCLIEINNIMLKEVKYIFEEENQKTFEIQGDSYAECWLHVLANYIKNSEENTIFLDYLFLRYFRIGDSPKKDDYIITNFIGSIEVLQNELLNCGNNIEQKSSAMPIIVSSFV